MSRTSGGETYTFYDRENSRISSRFSLFFSAKGFLSDATLALKIPLDLFHREISNALKRFSLFEWDRFPNGYVRLIVDYYKRNELKRSVKEECKWKGYSFSLITYISSMYIYVYVVRKCPVIEIIILVKLNRWDIRCNSKWPSRYGKSVQFQQINKKQNYKK